MEINVDELAIELANRWLQDVSNDSWYDRIGNSPNFKLKESHQWRYDIKVEQYISLIRKFAIDDNSTEKDSAEQTVYIGKVKRV